MPTVEEFLNEGNKCQRAGMLNKAIQAYQQALILDAHHPLSYINLLKVYLDLKNINAAVATYQQLINNIPQLANIYWLLLAKLIQETISNADASFLAQVLALDSSLSIINLFEKLDMELVKSSLLERIKALSNIELKLNVLCHALMPDTFLGAIFYFARHWRKPSLQRGSLSSIAKMLDDELLQPANHLLVHANTLQVLNKQTLKWQLTLKESQPKTYQILFNRPLVLSAPASASSSPTLISDALAQPIIEPSAPPIDLMENLIDFSPPPSYNPTAYFQAMSQEEPFTLINELLPQIKKQQIDLSDINKKYHCHFSKQIIVDPVVAADGFTYERANIEHWLTTHAGKPILSPITNKPLPHLLLSPNQDFRSEIINYLLKKQQTLNDLQASQLARKLAKHNPLLCAGKDLPLEPTETVHDTQTLS